MEDERWEPGMPVLDRQVVRTPSLPPSLQGLPPRSVPEVAPTPLQKHYIVVIAAPLLVVTTADAILRIWRSAWAWMPIDRVKGVFRLAWVAVSLIGLALLIAASIVVITA